jgi:hypothetical protein
VNFGTLVALRRSLFTPDGRGVIETSAMRWHIRERSVSGWTFILTVCVCWALGLSEILMGNNNLGDVG